MRCAHINGAQGIGKSTLLEETCRYLLVRGNHVLISANGRECTTVNDILSQFTRNLLASQSLEINESLNSFARMVGGAILSPTNSTIPKDKPEQTDSISHIFISKLGSILENTDATPVIIIEDLDSLSEENLIWLSTDLNQALRSSSQFKNCRFLFSSDKHISSFDPFWARFGFEKPVSMKMQPLSVAEIEELASSNGYKDVSAEDLTKASKGIPSIALKYLQNGFIMNNNYNKTDSSVTDQKIDLGDLSEKELEYLLYSSYPAKINRHNLEHFCSPKLAAFTYNWLKRRPDFCENIPGGDLIIKPSIKEKMRAFHLEQEPQKAEQYATLSSVLDAFYDAFPDIENHWIPVNLQAFNSFTKALCRSI